MKVSKSGSDSIQYTIARSWDLPQSGLNPALGFAMLAYKLMSLFKQAVFRGSVQHTLATLHHKVFAVGAFWYKDPGKQQLNLAVSRRRGAWPFKWFRY
ncbi:MAG: hypothetical protein WAT12_01260 [Candidatus Nitrotoga sp.]